MESFVAPACLQWLALSPSSFLGLPALLLWLVLIVYRTTLEAVCTNSGCWQVVMPIVTLITTSWWHLFVCCIVVDTRVSYVWSMLCLCGSDVNYGAGAGVVRPVGGHWRRWQGYPPGRIPQCVGLTAPGSVHSPYVVTTVQAWLGQCVHACLCALASVHIVNTCVYACVNVHVSERLCSLCNSLRL